VLVARDASVTAAPAVLETHASGRFRVPSGQPRLDLDHVRQFVEIPWNYLEMLSGDRPLALEWRAVSREVFEHLFARGCRVVDFVADQHSQRAGYLLARRV
jgi:predicted GNAT superfamily acetyltransferase